MIPSFRTVLPLLCATLAAAADGLWWEGEAATTHTFTNTDFAAKQYGERGDGLSGSDWLNTGGKVPDGGHRASWTITVPKAGTYQFWCRKFWLHGPFDWSFSNGAKGTCGKDIGLADSYELATHINANWVNLGSVDLPAGPVTLDIVLHAKAGEDAVACFDCFYLAPGSFTPKGKLKPGERLGLAEAGWWAFEPPADPFTEEALLDLRHLNERVAGDGGFLRREAGDFIRGDGRKERFWAVNVGYGVIRLSQDQVDYLAARLAKLGFNMVRIHGDLYDRSAGGLGSLDAKDFERMCAFVGALKKQGIYAKLSFYFPLWVDIKPEDGIPGYETIDNKKPFSLAFFDEDFQAIYKGWLKQIFTRPDPATGKPLSAETALGIVELMNEDSFLFWTFGEKNIPAPQWAKLERRFGAWLAQRHGGLAQAFAAWPSAKQPRDDAAAGIAQLHGVWNLTGEGIKNASPDQRARMSDQLRFLIEVQRDFYAEMTRYLKEDLGYRGLVSAGNWHTADDHLLDALERYTYTATDVIDKHSYFGPHWKKRQRNWTVTVGDQLLPKTGLDIPDQIPTTFVEYLGHPHIITETAWTTINRFQGEESFLFSSYGAMQGMDGIFYFALDGANWTGNGVSSPACLGQAPAFALQYRRRDVREAEPVVKQVLALDDLYAFQGSGSIEAQGIDDTRAVDVPKGGQAKMVVGSIDPLACYVGRVTRTFGDPKDGMVSDLSPYLDRKAKTIRSQTGELFWDYGARVVRVDTPRSQGVCGFLSGSGGSFACGDVTIRCGNEYAIIQVISLDGQPLAKAKRILIQAFTEQKMYGFHTEADGTIRDFGKAPINVRAIDAEVTFSGAAPRKATALDEHGYAKQELKLAGKTLRLPADSLYTIVER